MLSVVAKKRTAKKRVRTIEAEAAPAAELVTPPLERDLDRVLGQARALETLDAAISSGRIHHAWIFHGPAGVGKFTAALAFAAVILDPETAPDLSGRHRADPASAVQHRLRDGTHPDLHVIRKELALFSDNASVRGSKQMTIAKDVIDQRLLQPAYRAASLPGGLVSKVFIVDEAELLDRSASNAVSQNALLKTLEEPPEGTVIILVTSSEDRLLPTIRSRAQRVAFGPLPADAMAAWVSESGLDVGGDGGWLLGYAAGSPGRLVEAVETGLASWASVLGPGLEAADRGRYDPLLAPAMRDLVDAWAKAWVAQDDKRSKDAANRMALDRLFGMIGEHARGRLREPALAPRALGMIEAIGRAETLLRSNVQPALVLEGLAADLPAGG
jgi:DNA polymerase-3 subunit delta'